MRFVITRRRVPVARLTGIAARKSLSRERQLALERLNSGARPLRIGRVRRSSPWDPT
jgi:antitoxin (DNA-binding transcriptional repressor) of toxin-antitoxin stability system